MFNYFNFVELNDGNIYVGRPKALTQLTSLCD